MNKVTLGDFMTNELPDKTVQLIIADRKYITSKKFNFPTGK